MNDTIRNIRTLTMPVLRKYGIRSASIVGSYARNDQSRASDIDIILDITSPISLLTFSRIKLELEDVLKKKVDLIMS